MTMLYKQQKTFHTEKSLTHLQSFTRFGDVTFDVFITALHNCIASAVLATAIATATAIPSVRPSHSGIVSAVALWRSVVEMKI